MCSWCQISGTAEARSNVMTWKTSGRTQLHRAPRAGQARWALALPHCCPMAPKGQHSSRCHLRAQAGTAPSSTRPFCGRRIWWVRQWGGLPVTGDRVAGQGQAGSCHCTQSSLPCQPSWLLHQGRQDTWLHLSHPSHQGWEHITQGTDAGRKPSVALK